MVSSTALIVGSCVVALLIYLPITCYRNYQKCPGVKGPFLAKISGLWLFRVTCTARSYLDFPAALEKYDTTLVRIAPNKVVTNDPDIWRHMSTPRSPYTRGTWYDGINLDGKSNNVFACRDEKYHNILRSKMIRGYSGKEITNLELNIDNRIGDLINLIRSESAQGKLVDFAQLAQFFTLDLLTEIAFETPFGFITKNEDIFDYIKTGSAFLLVIEICCNFPLFRNIMSSRMMSGLSPKPTDKTGLGAMLGVARSVVQRRYAPDAKDHGDMLGSFKKGGLSQQEAENEAMLQILAGSDSTATTVRMTLLYILTNPSVYMKLRTEIDSNADKISKPVITDSEARALPYLQCCIKEGLRVFPPLVGLLTKIVPPGGETLNGMFIPEGIEVCWSPFSMQHRQDIYGPDAKLFRPERWLEAEAMDDGGATLAKMEKTFDLSFGSGRYTCLGKTIALIELNKVFVSLIQNFDFGIANPVTPMQSKCHGIHMQTNFWLQATDRVKG